MLSTEIFQISPGCHGYQITHSSLPLRVRQTHRPDLPGHVAMSQPEAEQYAQAAAAELSAAFGLTEEPAE